MPFSQDWEREAREELLRQQQIQTQKRAVQQAQRDPSDIEPAPYNPTDLQINRFLFIRSLVLKGVFNEGVEA